MVIYFVLFDTQIRLQLFLHISPLGSRSKGHNLSPTFSTIFAYYFRRPGDGIIVLVYYLIPLFSTFGNKLNASYERKPPCASITL